MPPAVARVARVLGWATVAGAAVPVALRLLSVESTRPTAALVALMPVLALPVYAVGVAAAAAARWRLAAVALAVAGAHLALVLPVYAPVARAGTVAAEESELRAFYANVYFRSDDLGGIVDEIGRSDADLVGLLEVTPDQAKELDETATLRRYPVRSLHPRPGAHGMAVWSRHPLDDVEEWYAADHVQLRGRMTVDGRSLRWYLLHTTAPRDGTGPWRRQLRAVRQELRSAAAGDVPVLVLADLNATNEHRGFRRILEAGYRDAAVEQGKGWVMTWPRGRPYPPVLRPDHVLVGGRLAVAGYRVGVGEGSDHRPLVVDLAID